MGSERILTIMEAKKTTGAELKPCRGCDLKPDTCDKQYPASVPTVPDTAVMCMIKGWVRREEKFVRINRNGKPTTNSETSRESAVAL